MTEDSYVALIFVLIQKCPPPHMQQTDLQRLQGRLLLLEMGETAKK